MKIRANFLLIAIFAIGLLTLTTTSCNKDTDPMVNPINPVEQATCDDGIQNGNETDVDCGGDCAACVTTVDEDKENIQTTLDNMLVCVDDMTSARAIDVLLRDFFNVSEGESYNDDWVENLAENFDSVFDFEHINETQRFIMSHHSGNYSYNHSSQSWQKDQANTESITVEFPTNPDATSNNARFIIDVYTDQLINLNGDEMFAPKTIHAQLDVDGQRLFELSVDKVTYASNTNYEIPVEVNAELFLEPMTISVDITRNSTTEFFGTIAMTDGNSCRISVEADVVLTDDDFENLTEESFEKIHGKIRVGDLTIESLAGLAELITMDDPEESTINSLLNLDVLFKDVKIADLEYSEEEENFIIYYKDSSAESAANYIDSFLEDMEAMIKEFTGEW